MYEYIKGIVVDKQNDSLTLENNEIGYKVFAPSASKFKIGEKVKVYILSYIREDEHSLYGFFDILEKEMFLKLISVKGLGYKTALIMLSSASPELIISAINEENVSYLKKFPKLGEKTAKQIILDLKGKLTTSEKTNYNKEVIESLKSLGYKSQTIENILKKIDITLPVEAQVKEALKLLMK